MFFRQSEKTYLQAQASACSFAGSESLNITGSGYSMSIFRKEYEILNFNAMLFDLRRSVNTAVMHSIIGCSIIPKESITAGTSKKYSPK